jgi:orotidine-5'-phosphate decarboxylase
MEAVTFKILRKTQLENTDALVGAARDHLQMTLEPIRQNVIGVAGERFLAKFIESFSQTGSPIVVNLDHNVSGRSLKESDKVLHDLDMIVRSTAGYVSGYKMNFQSMLTFLIAKYPEFVHEIRKTFAEVCLQRYGFAVEPVIWLDQKLGDIPSTNFQSADILFKLGFDALHALPQIGPDSVGAVQLAAERNALAGVIHVVNMTHEGYREVKQHYFKGEEGRETIDRLRELCLGKFTYPVNIGKDRFNVRLRAIGTIEPANRPWELFEGYRRIYKNDLMIISIGIGPQGALPGSALYSGATLEGIGRFIYQGKEGLDDIKNIEKKASLCNQCALIALSAKYSKKSYPVEEIMSNLKEFSPELSSETEEGLAKVFRARQELSQ